MNELKIMIHQPAQSMPGADFKVKVSMRAPWIDEPELFRFVPCMLEWRDDVMNAGGRRGAVLHKPNPDGIANTIRDLTQAAADHGYTVTVQVTTGFLLRWGGDWRNPAYCGPSYAESRRRGLEVHIDGLLNRPEQFRTSLDAQRIEQAQAELAIL